ncbi:hypothetical protein EW026_g6418 [Hermanssonia centrifuga]|uniref:Uncharacterized protein n=1 Tax=Hermanssonia centrifuga TaxID=98765 RepID=A0A4S4KCV9_9APHY|nr:hypothetical protein EW026_g6418 [Hermanssonia centrifuga]
MALVSLIGLIGSIGKLRSFIGFYAYTVTINTLVIMAAGIYLVWTLFHKREDSDVNKCVAGANGDVGDVKHWVCQKGFDVIRILVVVFFVIIWIFQLVGIFIVFDYVGQLREEAALEDEESRKSQPAWSVTAPTPSGPAMRTTYDAAPYDPPMQGGWQSAKSPYAFTGPSAQGQGR